MGKGGGPPRGMGGWGSPPHRMKGWGSPPHRVGGLGSPPHRTKGLGSPLHRMRGSGCGGLFQWMGGLGVLSGGGPPRGMGVMGSGGPSKEMRDIGPGVPPHRMAGMGGEKRMPSSAPWSVPPPPQGIMWGRVPGGHLGGGGYGALGDRYGSYRAPIVSYGSLWVPVAPMGLIGPRGSLWIPMGPYSSYRSAG